MIFKLIPFTFIILIFSRKANHFSEDEEDIFSEISYEFMKTNSYTQESINFKRELAESGGILLEELTDEIVEKIENSKVKVLVILNGE